MKKDKLLNVFTNNEMKALPKKSNNFNTIKSKKGMSPLDSGALIVLKGGDGTRPRVPRTN